MPGRAESDWSHPPGGLTTAWKWGTEPGHGNLLVNNEQVDTPGGGYTDGLAESAPL